MPVCRQGTGCASLRISVFRLRDFCFSAWPDVPRPRRGQFSVSPGTGPEWENQGNRASSARENGHPRQAGTSAPRRAIRHGQATNSRAPTAAGAPQNGRADKNAAIRRETTGLSGAILFRAISGLAAIWSQKQKEVIPRLWDNLLILHGRSDWIRTSDPLLPKQVRYQAAPRSVISEYMSAGCALASRACRHRMKKPRTEVRGMLSGAKEGA